MTPAKQLPMVADDMLTPAPLSAPSAPRRGPVAQALGRAVASPSGLLWGAAVGLVLLVVLMPIGAVVWLATASSDGAWAHLLANVLPAVLGETGLLVAGTALVTAVVGVGTAWLVTMHRFPGRDALDRLLILPLAMPTYIVAYCFAELFDYAGPVQSGLRAAFGWTSPQQYWFPDIRSLPGGVLVMSSVLYPYVYLTARASFVQQSVCVLEVARTLGRTSAGAFWAVALPLARPAIVAGIALVGMEVVNDLGAVQYLGLTTLSSAIYATWLQRSNLAGAAQLALAALFVVAFLLAGERWARRGARTSNTTGRWRAIPFEDLSGWRAMLAAALCALPVLIGFVLPAAVLAGHAVLHWRESLDGGFLAAAGNSLLLASLAAGVAVTIALGLAFARRVAEAALIRAALRLAGLGYALPGTVLAIGLLYPLAAFDNSLDAWMTATFGISTGLVLSGSLFAVTMAYVIRFLAVALGGVEAGFERISPNLDAAARALGATAAGTLLRIHLPLLLPALGAGALLVFVDAMKELPATLLLRPFNFDTLATHVYTFAALERVEAGALGALAIVATGLLPLLFLHRVIAGGRAGGHS